MEFPVFQFMPIASRPATEYQKEESGTIFFTHCVFMQFGENPLGPSLLWGKQSQLSQPLKFLSGYAPICPCLSLTSELRPGHNTQMCLTSAEQRGRISFLNLLAICFLMALRRLLGFFLSQGYIAG